MKKYSTLELWQKDLHLYVQNPNDTHLLDSIQRRFNNSSDTIKNKIIDILKSVVLEQQLEREALNNVYSISCIFKQYG
jgi:hypothetical protein